MGTPEFPASGPGAGITSQIEMNRATPIVFRNSRLGIGVIYFLSVIMAPLAICMAIMVISVLSSGGGISNAFWWGVGALGFGYGCPRWWIMARAMTSYSVTLDSRGANFNLGTKKEPSAVFFAWDQIVAITRKRVGNSQQYFVQGNDGRQARFGSYTFLSSGKLARLIAERTGLAIQKA